MSKFALADPPYPGQSKKHYSGHEDYAGEVDHGELIDRLLNNYDGWALHTSAPALFHCQSLLAERGLFPLDPKKLRGGGAYRIYVWVKPFAAFKRNVSPAYAWEPVIVKPLRKAEPNLRPASPVMRDWIAESITLKKGLTGVKPEAVCHWLFDACGLTADDKFYDLYPGTGAVGRAWQSWIKELREVSNG